MSLYESAVANSVAALLRYIRGQTGKLPHVYSSGPRATQS
jgi:hypothetical protein